MTIIDQIIVYYKKNNKTYGKGSPLNLWLTPERQTKRFAQITKIVDLHDKDILDVGCGYGDFYNYLLHQKIFPKSYLGIDLLEEHCEIAKTKLPFNCSILCGNFLEMELNTTQYVILSGTLNFYAQGWFKLAHQILDKAWRLSVLGIVFNLRSPHSIKGSYATVDNHVQELSPSYWCSYAHERTANYALYHNYVDYDYTIAMWKIQYSTFLSRDTLR